MFLLLVMFCLTVVPYAQESVTCVLDTVLNPPKASSFATIVEAFTAYQTYIAGVLVFLSVYVAQWIPGLANVLSFVKPYFRVIAIGGAILWALISWGKLHDTQASFSFILSNVIYIVLNLLKPLPTPPAQELFVNRYPLTDND